jgi:hypothetical protein
MKISRFVQALNAEIGVREREQAAILAEFQADPYKALRAGNGDRMIAVIGRLREAQHFLVDAKRYERDCLRSAGLDAYLQRRLQVAKEIAARQPISGKLHVGQILDDATTSFFQDLVDRFAGIHALEDLQGEVITRILGLKKDSDQVLFFFSHGVLRMANLDHFGSGDLLEIEGEEADFTGRPLLQIEVAHKAADKPDNSGDTEAEWTFYKLKSDLGYLDLRWYGNTGQTGMYSAQVDLTWYSAATAELMLRIQRPGAQREALGQALSPFLDLGVSIQYLPTANKDMQITFPASLCGQVYHALSPWTTSESSDAPHVDWNAVLVEGPRISLKGSP